MKAVVVIINHKEELNNCELISLQQCGKILRNYPIWMVVPTSLDTNRIESNHPFLRILRVKDSWLNTYRNFNQFKINPFIYYYFKSFDYLLFYELDAFVFEDKLEYWCSLGYDYIGAPWVIKNSSLHFAGVGNGGLSLRKISSHLKVLRTFKRLYSFEKIMKWYGRFNARGKLRYLPELLLRLSGFKANTLWAFNDYSGNEDEFWSHMGSLFPWFKIPDATLALQFSFEMHPEDMFSINNNKLPFGCHAWYKGDQLKFWKPFVKKEGYTVGDENC
jgi:hypothetical protein